MMLKRHLLYSKNYRWESKKEKEIEEKKERGGKVRIGEKGKKERERKEELRVGNETKWEKERKKERERK